MRLELQSKTEETVAFDVTVSNPRVPPQFVVLDGHTYQFRNRDGEDAAIYARVSLPEILILDGTQPL